MSIADSQSLLWFIQIGEKNTKQKQSRGMRTSTFFILCPGAVAFLPKENT